MRFLGRLCTSRKPTANRGIICAALAAFTLLTAGGAAAQIVHRSPVGVQGRNATRGYSSKLFIQLASPATYAGAQRDIDKGDWTGPHWQSAGNASRNGNAQIGWRVEYDDHMKSADAAARGARVQDFPASGNGTIDVPHLIGSQKIGTIPGVYVLIKDDDPGREAQFESGLGFPLCRGLFVGVEFFTDSPEALDDVIQSPKTAALDWNRSQISEALAGVAVQGNLPPGRIVARGAKGRVTGTASDCQGHPYVGGKVALQNAAGRAVSTAKTDAHGHFVLRARAHGTYRVVASYSPEFKARSAPVHA